jgi:hypothetical protein
MHRIVELIDINWSYFSWLGSPAKRKGYTFLTQTSLASGWVCKIDMTSVRAGPAQASPWQASGKPATVLGWAMGDKSPKDKQKQATQKQTKNKATNRQKEQAVAAKQAGNSSKRSK